MHGEDGMPHVSPVRFTWDDLQLWPDDGLRREIVDGAPFVTPTPVWKHQAIVTNVGVATCERAPSGA